MYVSHKRSPVFPTTPIMLNGTVLEMVSASAYILLKDMKLQLVQSWILFYASVASHSPSQLSVSTLPTREAKCQGTPSALPSLGGPAGQRRVKWSQSLTVASFVFLPTLSQMVVSNCPSLKTIRQTVGLWMSSTYIASVLKFALYSNLGKAVKEVIKEFNDHPPVDITVLQHSIVELNKWRLIQWIM